jgi:hypothetical protein
LKAHSSGRFNQNWGLLSPTDISSILNDLKDKLKSQPHGVGDVLVTLLGRGKAEEVAKKENEVLRITMTSKRPMEQSSSSDNHHNKRIHLSDSE